MTFLAACPPGDICTPRITLNLTAVGFWVALILLLFLTSLFGGRE